MPYYKRWSYRKLNIFEKCMIKPETALEEIRRCRKLPRNARWENSKFTWSEEDRSSLIRALRNQGCKIE